ncbi:MAG: hypothetical protein WCL18_04655 [bacterium]
MEKNEKADQGALNEHDECDEDSSSLEAISNLPSIFLERLLNNIITRE